MNHLHLQVIDKSKSNCYHVKLFVDEQECGILYLKEEQFYFFKKALQVECSSKDVQFDVSDPFSDDTEEDFDSELDS